MYLSTSSVICLVAIIGLAASANYCDPSLCGPYDGIHVACGHNGQFAKSCLPGARLVRYTSDLQKYILHLHNEKRNLVAGGGVPGYGTACRMATMQWDDELAKLAELNVMKCKMDHDCQNTKTYPDAGQNLAYQSYFVSPNQKELIKSMIDGWFAENRYCNMGYINRFPEDYSGPVITHFTGMVIENNNRIGCAASTYSVQGEDYKIYLLACNMATKTMATEAVYTSCAAPASKCTSGKNYGYTNLCKISEQFTRSG